MNVLYLIFNRPHLQTASFEQIRAARPQRLFIAADGPRAGRDDDSKKCDEARRIVDKIDWPCEVKTLFRDQNLGCRAAVVEAINWFFDHVEEGIIIEDDCVASQAFFDYAELLLQHYREDTRIWCVSGNNYQGGVWRGDGSYYFSRYCQIWGWATWRRCWRNYDSSLSNWSLAKDQKLVGMCFPKREEEEYWTAVWEGMSKPETAIDTWDYQWIYTVISNGGLTACPNRNLVTNVGYGGDGTHCFGTTPDPGIEEFVEGIVHPSFVIPNVDADRATFQRFFRGEVDVKGRNWIRLFARKIKTRLASKRCR